MIASLLTVASSLFLTACLPLNNKLQNNETIMSKHSQTAMNIAHDRFITIKNQIIY